MKTERDHIKAISKVNPNFPPYLDFQKLRTDGIAYLGKLSGKIWTDHNIHDPGITILEILCYALLDLGYRTNLPELDLLSKDPNDNSKENNFFTAAQILSCNPLNLMDYRKLLIDIEGVKNAWIEIASDQLDFCLDRSEFNIQASQNLACNQFLNGLYHVFIESEKDINSDFSNENLASEYFNELTKSIRNRLMTHRNFCEDFVDITYLCKIDVGICADIELNTDANIDKVYTEIIQGLRDFISPSPKFYTLQQLLDKDRTIEEIFSGRPYNLAESHGFIDSKELEQINLRKEIHLSDLYQIILNVEGVKSVNNLLIKNCQAGFFDSSTVWKFKLPKNYTANFSLACTQIKFSKNDIPIQFDAKKFEGLFHIQFANSGKVLFQSPSEYLDRSIPQGNYYQDLDEYYLLQDDFPRVYGIADGGLSDDATKLRKAQALQLKGYLLFFDQVLAGYLSQLKNIRTLFAMNSATDPNFKRTYFLNKLVDKPELSKLLRFAVGDEYSTNLGETGNILVRSVSYPDLLDLIELNKSSHVNPDDLIQYYSPNLNKLNVVINQFKEDFISSNYQIGLLNADSQEIHYYIIGTSTDFALLSKIGFPSVSAASLHANSVVYVGSFEENYSSFIVDENNVSFNLELNISSFKSYLSKIIEDEDLYSERRNGFLDHLLSRFAEKFTDHIIDQFNYDSRIDYSKRLISAKEDFLSNYDSISANRGKAYDYLQNNWNNSNISGFENEAKFLAGIENKEIHSLCNFIVEPLDDYYLVELKIDGEPYFSLNERFDSEAEAEEVAQVVYESISNPEKLTTKYIPHNKSYAVELHYNESKSVSFYKQYPTSQDADAVRLGLNRMFNKEFKDEIHISSYEYQAQLVNQLGEIIRTSTQKYPDDKAALEHAEKTISKINDPSEWTSDSNNNKKISQLTFISSDDDVKRYLDIKAFKIIVNNNIVGKPEQFTYDILDSLNTFKFYAVHDFSSNKLAKENATLVLILATNPDNYLIKRDSLDSAYKLHILNKDQVEATCYSEFNTEMDALEMQNKIISTLINFEYKLIAEKFPKGWKFDYYLGYEPDSNFKFSSTKEYLSEQDAVKASQKFQSAIPTLKVGNSKNGPILIQQNKNSKLPSVNLPTEFNSSEDMLLNALTAQKNILQYSKTSKTQNFKTAVRKEENENTGRFIYKLVDKDRVLASFQQNFENKSEAEYGKRKVAKLFRRKLKHLQICLGGSIIKEVIIGNGKIKKFRYQLKAHNLYYKNTEPKNQEIVLFESMNLYDSQDLALLAFEENYFNILKLAAQLNSYGNSIIFDVNQSNNNLAVVYIPIETQLELESYGNGSVQKLLIEWVNSYPIKEKDGVFYFSTFNNSKDPEIWQSMKTYSNPAEAMQEFNFFLMLLKYSGNLFVDCDLENNGYKIYIREVLAESTERYLNEEAAWGENGVENFICAIQSNIGFHKYQIKDSCCHSFYLNCGPDLIIHPCKYDTAKKRNQVMLDLYNQFKLWIENKAFTSEIINNNLVLKDEKGQEFAIKTVERTDNQEPCNMFFDIVEELSNHDNFYDYQEELIVLKNKNGQIILSSYNKGWSIESFKKQVEMFLCYFPVKRTRLNNSDLYQYDIEIKLPGFNSCNKVIANPCSCNENPIAQDETCFVAWKSSCSYQTCEEAMRMYAIAIQILNDFNNYNPEIDCECNSFGISLNFDFKSSNERYTYYNNQDNIKYAGRPIAKNPQCYDSSQELCEAIERTIGLSHSEGLHAVEHILLRPRCEEDCLSRKNYQCYGNMRENQLVWDEMNEDPCSEAMDVCFIPESDPYSFISTVVLPAWPKRFRTESGRLLMEDILYNIAPAHVMLRILWLGPHDFCCFENKYKQWRRYLAMINNCLNDFSVDDFLNFLFYRNFKNLEECHSCLPCQNDVIIENPCIRRGQDVSQVKSIEFVDQVNETFCWNISDPLEYYFINCNNDQNENDYILKRKEENKTIVKNEEVSKELVSSPLIKKRNNPKEYNLLIEKRILSYRNTVDLIAEKFNKNGTVLSVQKYLRDSNAVFNELETLVNKVIENKKTSSKNVAVLNQPQSKKIIESIICFALDHLNFKKENKSDLSTLNLVFEKLRKSKIDVAAIYNHWDGTELKKYQPSMDVLEIKNLLLGINK